MRTISIVDPKDTKDQVRRAVIRMAIETLIANTAEINRVDTTEDFASSFTRTAIDRANSLWDDPKIVVRTSTSHEEGITVEEAEFDKKSLEDMTDLLNTIVKLNINIGDKIEFCHKGKKAQGFMSKTANKDTTVSIAFVTNTEWGSDEDMYL